MLVYRCCRWTASGPQIASTRTKQQLFLSSLVGCSTLEMHQGLYCQLILCKYIYWFYCTRYYFFIQTKVCFRIFKMANPIQEHLEVILSEAFLIYGCFTLSKSSFICGWFTLLKNDSFQYGDCWTLSRWWREWLTKLAE